MSTDPATAPEIPGYLVDADGNYYRIASGGGSSTRTLDDYQDVDTSTVPPLVGDQLMWDGTNWVPQAP